MIKSATGLKANIRNISKGNSDVAQSMIRIFFMERFLERLSLSKYKHMQHRDIACREISDYYKSWAGKYENAGFL
jgi:hypothetical protein